MTASRQPPLYIPHGGRPCFFASASNGAGQRIYSGTLMEAAVSGFRFD